MHNMKRIISICTGMVAVLQFLLPGALAATSAGAPSTTATKILKIVDESGRPVKEANAGVVETKYARYTIPKWKAVSADGEVPVTLSNPDSNHTVYIKAPGFVRKELQLEGAVAKTQTVPLDRGTTVFIELKPQDGRSVPPDLLPIVYTPATAAFAWMSFSHQRADKVDEQQNCSYTAVSSHGNGRYSVNIDRNSTETVSLVINHPGFIRAFGAGPFKPADWATSRTVVIPVPEPATLTANFASESDDTESTVVTLGLTYDTKLDAFNGKFNVTILTEEMPVGAARMEVTDLAPGTYYASAKLTNEKNWNNQRHSHASTKVQLTAGDSTSVTLNYVPFDQAKITGGYSAIVTLLNADGTPAAGKDFKIVWQEDGFPAKTLAKGAVPTDGVIRAAGLAGVDEETSRDAFKAIGGVPSYDVLVDGKAVGYLLFSEARGGKLYPPKEGKTKKYTFRIPPDVGDIAPDLNVVDLTSDKLMRLSDLKGQVVVLDFWATWCPPCQPVMEKNQVLLKKRGNDWNGKATILALSIDNDKETVEKHLQKNGWTHTLNAWAPAAENDPDQVGWDAPATETYGVQSVPTLLLIDRDGVIRRRGHFDVEKEVDALLQQAAASQAGKKAQ